MKKILLTIVILVFAAAGWIFLRNKGEVATASPTPALLVSPESTASSSPVSSNGIITYTDSGYSPSTITIKKGGTVTWKNKSSGGMWTASNPHPIHTGYPKSGGCINSAFDECKSGPSGAEWSFTFTYTGTWGYHNHLNPAHTGQIIVE